MPSNLTPITRKVHRRGLRVGSFDPLRHLCQAFESALIVLAEEGHPQAIRVLEEEGKKAKV